MKLLFLGDFFFDNPSFPEDLEKIAEFIKINNYKVILNLEGALGKQGNPIKKRGANLSHSPCVYEALGRLNVVAVCLANNHMMDYGEASLLKGINELRMHNIKYVGAGENINVANEPLRLNVDGKTIYILNCGWDVEETVYATNEKAGCAALVSDRIIAQNREIRRSSPNAIIINCFHWGFEFNTLPMPMDVQFAHDCIDSGADLIIGHHPHVVQPKELWHGKEIFYSLGNFYFASRRSKFTAIFPNDFLPNMCDYGLAVEFDLETQETNYFSVLYDRDIDQTVLKSGSNLFLSEITGVDYKSDAYAAKVKEHSSNCNPILGCNKELNEKKLKKLFFHYWVADKIRFIRKNRLGERIYTVLKKTVNR